VKRLILLLLIAFPLTAEELRLEVSLEDRELRALVDGNVVDTWPVAIGKDEKPTPTGSFRIRKVIWNPAWRPPNEKWARGKRPTPPGHKDNPMKVVKMFFREPDYYIHGTADNDSLGAAESHGCLRMHKNDVEELGKMVMAHGGKPMPEPWYRRIFRGRTTKVVYLATPIPISIWP
jgi:lipoprotein-anchoring transpeptidase ErfK/SrfK